MYHITQPKTLDGVAPIQVLTLLACVPFSTRIEIDDLVRDANDMLQKKNHLSKLLALDILNLASKFIFVEQSLTGFTFIRKL